MARLRTLKHEFFKNEDLAEIAPLGRLLFAGLWTIADRDGRLEDRPKRIKAETLPYDECDADALLTDLADRGFILRYEVDGERYIQVCNFAKHQNPHQREAPSTIPAPPYMEGAPDKHCADTVPAPEKPSLSRVGSGDLVIGEWVMGSGDLGVGESAPQADAAQATVRSAPKKPKIPIRPDMALTDSMRELAESKLEGVDADALFEHFRDKHIANRTLSTDWEGASWRTWIRTAIDINRWPRLPGRSLAIANGRASPDPPRVLTAYERRVQERGAAK